MPSKGVLAVQFLDGLYNLNKTFFYSIIAVMILGHKRVISRLNAILANGNIPHAFIFYGPENIGKLTVAKEFAKSLVCLKNKNCDIEKNCDICSECLAINGWRQPEVIFFEPGRHLTDEKTAVKEIGIGDVRELKRILSLKAPEGKYRPVVINSAESLTEEAQNSLLKIIEEPGEGTIFILICKSPDLLLPTIVSRSVSIGFSPLGADEIKKFLLKKILSDSRIEELIEASFGRPGLIFRFLEDIELMREEVKKAAEVKKVISDHLVKRFNYAEKISQDDLAIKEFFNHFYFILRDIFLKNFERQESLISPKRFVSIMKSADEISNAIYSTNVNRRLALEAFFLELE